jgi:chemotaxis protein methyltransferase CheR
MGPAMTPPGCGTKGIAVDTLEDLEIQLLLEGICHHAGYDFRNYLPPMVKRRIWQCVRDEKLRTISGFQEKTLHDPDCLLRLVQALSINVSSLFRDPHFFLALRRLVLPRLRTYPFIRIWHAGCATGEEAYSLAILLQEEGIYDRCRIYATDMNAAALVQAKKGIIPCPALKESATAYVRAGGRGSLSDHYLAAADGAVFAPALRKNIVFAQHNLVTDGSFNEFNLICCRNVLIYFNQPLQGRVHQLFHESLVRFGMLGLGSKESIQFSRHEHCYEEIDREQRLYRKIR